MRKYLDILVKINLKTIYFNFKYLPFKQAIKFPFYISKKVYFREMNGSVELKAPIYPGKVKIGYGKVGIFDDVKSRTIWEVSGKITFNGKADIGHGSKISIWKTGFLEIGENLMITAETSIVCSKYIKIGNNCLLSWDILFMDSDLHNIYNSNNEKINHSKPIIINDKVWIGCRCTILKGANIPKGAIIGANSLVNQTLNENNAIYSGTPAKKIKSNILWN